MIFAIEEGGDAGRGACPPQQEGRCAGACHPLHPKGNQPGLQRPYCKARQVERAAGVAVHFMVCFRIVRASATGALQ